jgi:hypothetical protein
VGRRTETGYQALRARASGRVTAKLSRPEADGVNPAAAQRRPRTLTWGDLALRLKGRRREAEREVSRGRSSDVEAGQGAPVTPEVFSDVKGRTERRAKRP